MKKKGAYKYIQLVDGGVCAPKSFKASTRFVPFYETEETQDNVGLIGCKIHCATACVFGDGVCNAVSKKHFTLGHTRAVCLVGKRALMGEDKRFCAERICREIAIKLQTPDEEVLIATCGEMCCYTDETALMENAAPLANALSHTPSSVGMAIGGKEAACSFQLSNFEGKFGAVYSGDGATTCVLTTDVCIASDMLQKALSTAVKDTFALTEHGAQNSPNNFIAILANGEAGNYNISCQDTEYKKFLVALEEFLAYICRDLAREKDNRRLLVCTVKNAKSKQASRAFSKAIVCSSSVKQKTGLLDFDLQGIIGAMMGTGEPFDLEKISILYRADDTEFMLLEDGRAGMYVPLIPEWICEGETVEIVIDCKEGNYASTAYGGIFK